MRWSGSTFSSGFYSSGTGWTWHHGLLWYIPDSSCQRSLHVKFFLGTNCRLRTYHLYSSDSGWYSIAWALKLSILSWSLAWPWLVWPLPVLHCKSDIMARVSRLISTVTLLWIGQAKWIATSTITNKYEFTYYLVQTITNERKVSASAEHPIVGPKTYKTCLCAIINLTETEFDCISMLSTWVCCLDSKI